VNRDYSGTDEIKSFPPFNAGVYGFIVTKIEDTKTRDGVPMAKVTCSVANKCDSLGRLVFENITFHEPDAPGAGFTKHWLRVIGQPFEGNVNYDTQEWLNAAFIGKVGYEEYKGRVKNTIEESWHVDDDDAPEFSISSEPIPEPKNPVPTDEGDGFKRGGKTNGTSKRRVPDEEVPF